MLFTFPLKINYGNWVRRNLPDLKDKTYLVTGANSGLGFEISKQLAAHHARVLLGCRSVAKGKKARQQILSEFPKAHVEVVELDLADLKQLDRAASKIAKLTNKLDGLVNNAGIMAGPQSKSKDGFELQFATNHLGHFFLTRKLISLLAAAPKARVVTMTSFLHKFGRMNWHDLNLSKNYSAYGAYSQSKLANILFSVELNRRTRASGYQIGAYTSHPGYSGTNLQGYAFSRVGGKTIGKLLARLNNFIFSQPASIGALGALYALTHANVQTEGIYGPNFILFGGIWGYPVLNPFDPQLVNVDDAKRLWELSESLIAAKA